MLSSIEKQLQFSRVMYKPLLLTIVIPQRLWAIWYYVCVSPPNTKKPSSLKSLHPTQSWTFCDLVRQEVMIWNSEGFELLPVLKDQVSKKGCDGNPKLHTTLFTVFFNLSSLYSFRYISSVTLHGLNCFCWLLWSCRQLKKSDVTLLVDAYFVLMQFFLPPYCSWA